MLTKSRGHATALTRAIAETGDYVRLYACGGDGTVNEIANGIAGFPNAAMTCIPIGIQQHSNTVSLFKKAEELGVDYVLAKDLQASNLESILERMDQFLYQCDDTYITVCSDVFSSAFAPGVSAPQSLGLDPEIVLPLIKHVLRTRKVRGFDICEISPRFDQDNTTANLGAVIIFAVVNTLCRLNGLSI